MCDRHTSQGYVQDNFVVVFVMGLVGWGVVVEEGKTILENQITYELAIPVVGGGVPIGVMAVQISDEIELRCFLKRSLIVSVGMVWSGGL